MKTKIFITAVCLLLVVLVFGQNKQSGKAEIITAKVENSIQSRCYEIIVDQVHPMNGSVRHLIPSYQVRISNDSVNVYLPYFGRAYSVPMNDEGGIKLDTLMEDYKADYKEGKNYSINFNAKGFNDIYRFSITIWTNGKTSIYVTCKNRQAISYSGELKLPDE